MISLNKQIIGGNLAADSEVFNVSDQRDVIRFRVITSESWTDRQGERQEKTCGHDVVRFGKKGQFDKLKDILVKGTGVYVEGTTEKEMRDGDNGQRFLNVTVNASFGELQITKYVTEKPESQGSTPKASAQKAPANVPVKKEEKPEPSEQESANISESNNQASAPEFQEDPDEDIPF